MNRFVRILNDNCVICVDWDSNILNTTDEKIRISNKNDLSYICPEFFATGFIDTKYDIW
jgi:hypothetical protein